MEIYRHTQIGYPLIVGLAIPVAVELYLIATVGFTLIVAAILGMLLLTMLLFATLTVTIAAGEIVARYGIGLIRKRFLLSEVASCRIVRNKWYYGWGIRLTPHGWLYNISGLDAVELEFKDGKKNRIGTDKPADLERAVQEAMALVMR
ncbi:MAG: hypothetical protein FJ215_01545 [Ignavibacteria bacterium]|nr:hypothetical protein [Ignavibacteria bacterium]